MLWIRGMWWSHQTSEYEIESIGTSVTNVLKRMLHTVGTFFLKRKVEIRYPCKHVLWRVDICNILLRGGIFPNILLLINPKYYQLLSEGHPFQISSAYKESELWHWLAVLSANRHAPPPTVVSAISDNGQHRCLSTAMSAACDIYPTRCRPNVMSAQRDVAQGRKRAFGVAKRPREISSDQPCRHNAYFFRKMQNIRKT